MTLDEEVPVARAETRQFRPPMDTDEIYKYLPHRAPFQLLDRVTALDPPKRAVGLKNISVSEPWFPGHFPGASIMPGVIIHETMAHLAGLLVAAGAYHAYESGEPWPPGSGRLGLFAGAKRVRFRGVVRPGDQVRMVATRMHVVGPLIDFRVDAHVGRDCVAEATITIAL